MANIPEGILGTLVGRIGPISGYKKGNISILRSSKNNVLYKKTAARKRQQEKLVLVNRFVQAFKGTGFFDRSYAGMASKGYGYHKAVSAIMNLAVKDSPAAGFNLSYPDILVSRGLLPTAQAASVERDAVGQLCFRWVNNSYDGTAKPNDSTILVAYAPEIGMANWSIGTSNRAATMATLDMQPFSGMLVETWIGFLNADGSQASDSVWTGGLQL